MSIWSLVLKEANVVEFLKMAYFENKRKDECGSTLWVKYVVRWVVSLQQSRL